MSTSWNESRRRGKRWGAEIQMRAFLAQGKRVAEARMVNGALVVFSVSLVRDRIIRTDADGVVYPWEPQS